MIYQGGSLEELESCARSQGVTALYALTDGGWVSYTPGAPEAANQPFQQLFPEGLAAVTALAARSEAPSPPTDSTAKAPARATERDYTRCGAH